MGKNRTIGLLFISFFFATMTVGAATCDFEEKAKLNNEVGNVKINYEILQKEIKDAYPPDSLIGTDSENEYKLVSDYIQVNVFNLTENSYIEVHDDYTKETKRYNYNDSTNGTISFESPSLRDIVKYKIEVLASDKTGCEGTKLKTLNITLPRFNEFSRYGVCSSLKDYYLCQEYVTFPDNVSFQSFTDMVMKESEKREKEEEYKNKKWYEKIGDFVVEHKTVLIVGTSLIIVGGTIVLVIKKRRSDEI